MVWKGCGLYGPITACARHIGAGIASLHPSPIRRSVLITPGSRPARNAHAAQLACDSVVIDLEDRVAPAARDAARATTIHALWHVDFGQRQRAVRVNAPQTSDLDKDLTALAAVSFDGLWIPKVECIEQVSAIADRLPAAVPLIALLTQQRATVVQLR